MTMIHPTSIVVRHGNLHGAETSSQTVLLSLQKNCFYGMNEAGNRIWQLLKTPHTVEELCRTLDREYAVPKDQCSQEVTHFLIALSAHGLIRVTE